MRCPYVGEAWIAGPLALDHGRIGRRVLRKDWRPLRHRPGRQDHRDKNRREWYAFPHFDLTLS